MNKIEKQVTLTCKMLGSDKIYKIELVQVDGGYLVNFWYGARGATLRPGTKTKEPLPLAEAEKVYDKLVASQKKPDREGKFYTEGEAGPTYQATAAPGKKASGLLPQLLNMIEEDEAYALCSDDEWMAQEKKDGDRQMLRKTAELCEAINRKGEVIPIRQEYETDLRTFPIDITPDGEAVGDTYWTFDILNLDGKDLRGKTAEERWLILSGYLKAYPDLQSIKLVPCEFTTGPKLALFSRLKREGAEGIVFKRRKAKYKEGRPNSGGDQRKFKFWTSGTFRVAAINRQRSVQLECMYDEFVPAPKLDADGGYAQIGNVTIPPNKDIPDTGALIEVRYLYFFPGGSLYQPTFLGLRTDLEHADYLSTLKTKAGTDEDSEA